MWAKERTGMTMHHKDQVSALKWSWYSRFYKTFKEHFLKHFNLLETSTNIISKDTSLQFEILNHFSWAEILQCSVMCVTLSCKFSRSQYHVAFHLTNHGWRIEVATFLCVKSQLMSPMVDGPCKLEALWVNYLLCRGSACVWILLPFMIHLAVKAVIPKKY